MTTRATLIGIVRSMPEVLTFVTPVFVNSDGTRVVQHISNDGMIAGFVPIDAKEQVVGAAQDIAARVGEQVIHGFETVNSTFLFDTGPELAKTLTNEPGLVYPLAEPAVQRFAARWGLAWRRVENTAVEQ